MMTEGNGFHIRRSERQFTASTLVLSNEYGIRSVPSWFTWPILNSCPFASQLIFIDLFPHIWRVICASPTFNGIVVEIPVGLGPV